MLDDTQDDRGISLAKELGRAKGFHEGMVKGVQLGFKEGRLEGRREGRLEGANDSAIWAAKRLLSENETVETIARYTELSTEEIMELEKR